MNETSYIKSIHRQLPPSTYCWKIHDNFAGGVADAYYDDVAGFLFVEYKYQPKVPKRDSTILIPDCSALQKNWLRERVQRDIPAVVVLGTPIGGIVFAQCTWEDGITKENLSHSALTAKKIAEIISNHVTGTLHINHNRDVMHER